MVLGISSEELEQCSWKSSGKGLANGKIGEANGLGRRAAEPPTERVEDFENFIREVQEADGWEQRVRIVGLDGRCESLPPASSRSGRFCRLPGRPT